MKAENWNSQIEDSIVRLYKSVIIPRFLVKSDLVDDVFYERTIEYIDGIMKELKNEIPDKYKTFKTRLTLILSYIICVYAEGRYEMISWKSYRQIR